MPHKHTHKRHLQPCNNTPTHCVGGGMCYLNATCRPTGQDDIEALGKAHSVNNKRHLHLTKQRHDTPDTPSPDRHTLSRDHQLDGADWKRDESQAPMAHITTHPLLVETTKQRRSAAHHHNSTDNIAGCERERQNEHERGERTNCLPGTRADNPKR